MICLFGMTKHVISLASKSVRTNVGSAVDTDTSVNNIPFIFMLPSVIKNTVKNGDIATLFNSLFEFDLTQFKIRQ